MVPIGVIKLHEPHATFDKAASQEAIHGERWLSGLRPITIERLLRLTRKVHQLGRTGLHPESHFIGGNASRDFRVSRFSQTQAIKLADAVDKTPLVIASDTRRVRQIEDWRASAAKRY